MVQVDSISINLMQDILIALVLQNNPDLYVHAAKIQNNLIPDMTGQLIAITVDSEHVPKGYKLQKNGYQYTFMTKVIVQDNFNMEKPYLTEYGWKAVSKNSLSVLEPIS